MNHPAPKDLKENATEKNSFHWSWSAILAAIVLITLAFRYALPIRDGDIWFHLLYAKYFIEHHTLIPDHTIYSWSPTTGDIIYCTWLSEFILYGIYKIGSLNGLFIFRYFCLVLYVFIAWLFARKVKMASHPLTWLIIFLGMLMSYMAALAKPEIFSYVIMSLLVWNWWHLRTDGDKAWKNCYFFPVLMLLWVNSHGGFVFGFLFLATAGAGEILNGYLCPQFALPKTIKKHLSYALGLSILSVFITPYGYKYPLQLFFSLIPTSENLSFIENVGAYLSPFSGSGNHFGLASTANLAVIVIAFLLFANIKNKQLEWSSILTNLLFAFLFTSFLRTTFYWAPVFAFSAIALLSKSTRLWRCKSLKINTIIALSITSLAFFLGGKAIIDGKCAPQAYAWRGFGIPEAAPVEEAQFIKDNFHVYKLGNSYDQGSYLLWSLWPENKIFIDARHFPYREWVSEYWDFSNGKNIPKFLQKYPCDIWCLSLAAAPKTCLYLYESPEWKLVFFGRAAAIFVKKNIPWNNEKYIVGKSIDTIKNLFTAQSVFNFTLAINDWTTAKRIVKNMEQTFDCETDINHITNFRTLLASIDAYNKRNYQEAAELFTSTSPRIINRNNWVLISSYIHLTGEAWEKNNDQEALRYARKALNLMPYHPHTVFNIAIIEWDLLVNKKITAVDAINIKPGRWREYLKTFAEQTPSNLKLEEYIDVAQKILQGSFNNKRPNLIVPPNTTFRQLKEKN